MPRLPEQFANDVAGLSALVGAAWSEARAFPDREAEIYAALMDELRRISSHNSYHLRRAYEEVERQTKALATREHAREKAWEAAERHIDTALAQAHTEALGDALNVHRYVVYCLWGRNDDRPLYVGRSENYLSRLGSHMGDIRKRPNVTRVTITSCRTHRQMCELEGRLIRKFQPPLNIVGIA